MLSIRARSVAHYGMYVPCFEGQVLAFKGQPTRLIRLNTRVQAEAYAQQFERDLTNNRPLSCMMGDNYMLTQPPLTGGIGLIVGTAAADWINSGEAESLEGINEGLCADFADRLSKAIPDSRVVGVYDVADLDELSCPYTGDFSRAVRSGLVGHTCIEKDGVFYDAESPQGVRLFEHLPINQRAKIAMRQDSVTVEAHIPVEPGI